jgi:hypothetical protein
MRPYLDGLFQRGDASLRSNLRIVAKDKGVIT